MQTESFMSPKECTMVGGGYCPCPLEEVADVLCRKWTLTILVIIGNFGVLRFNDILRRIGNLTPKTLADRLKHLQMLKLVKRQAYHEIPPRVEYSLTAKGAKLRRAVIPLMQWAVKQKR